MERTIQMFCQIKRKLNRMKDDDNDGNGNDDDEYIEEDHDGDIVKDIFQTNNNNNENNVENETNKKRKRNPVDIDDEKRNSIQAGSQTTKIDLTMDERPENNNIEKDFERCKIENELLKKDVWVLRNELIDKTEKENHDAKDFEMIKKENESLKRNFSSLSDEQKKKLHELPDEYNYDGDRCISYKK